MLMETLAGGILGVLLGTVVELIILIPLVFVFNALWNSSLPELFGLKTISAWQAIKFVVYSFADIWRQSGH
jgi:hypothetical protein